MSRKYVFAIGQIVMLFYVLTCFLALQASDGELWVLAPCFVLSLVMWNVAIRRFDRMDRGE